MNYGDEFEFSRLVHEGMEALAAEKGYELFYEVAKSDAQKMISAADNFILQGADYIVDFNFNPGGGEAIKQKADEEGIVLIGVDYWYGDGTYFVGVDNPAVGIAAAEGVARFIEDQFDGEVDKIAYCVAAALGPEIMARVKQTPVRLAELGIKFEEEDIVEFECGTGDATQLAKQQATDFLTANEEAKKILFVASNDQAGLGFLAAIESQNRSDDTIIVVEGFEDASVVNIRIPDSPWVGAVDFKFKDYAQTIMGVIDTLEAGGQPPVYSFTELGFVDGDNIDELYPEQ